MNPTDIFEKIIKENLVVEGVTVGKMMSSPALKYNNKVYAFFHKDEMVFKLGYSFDLEAFDIPTFELLSPFKTKPPLKNWLIINKKYADKWRELTAIALSKMKS